MADDRIEVEIVLDDGSIQKGFAKLRSEAKKSEKSLGAIFKKGLTADISKPFDIATKSVFNLKTAVAGVVGVIGGATFLRTITAAASQQQDAVNALNVSLASAGTFSEEASQSFQKLASELQAQSRFGDEVILQQAALARNYARSNEEAERLVAVSVDLAAATGISLDSAVRNLGKTFSGLQGELGESIPALRNLTAEQLKAGGALDLIADRFAGSALGATRTYSGALAQLQNTFGDLLEKIGAYITESPVIINLFNALSKTIQNFQKSFGGSGDQIDQFLKDLVLATAGAVTAVLDSFEAINQIPNFFRWAYLTAKIETINFVNEFFKLIEPATSWLDKVLGDEGASTRAIQQNDKLLKSLRMELDALGDSSIKTGQGFRVAKKLVGELVTTFQELSVTASTSVDPKNSPTSGIVKAVDKDLIKLRDKVFQLQLETEKSIRDAFINSEEILAGTPTVFENVETMGTKALEKLQVKLLETKNKTTQLSNQIGQAINNGIANTITNAIGAAVDALRAGEDAFGAFAKAALATIGDLAIQLGQTLIASGIGIEALKVLGGAAAIAAGIALVAVGTLIKGAAAGGNTSTAGGSAVTPPLSDLQPGGISGDLQEPGARVEVNIEGQILSDDDTVGLRIADILKDQGFQNAVVT